MNFVELTEVGGEKIQINLDTVTAMKPNVDVMGQTLTMLIFKDDARRFFVTERPDTIISRGTL